MGEHQDAQDMGAKNQKATKLSQGSCCALCMLSSLPTVSHLLFYCIEDAMRSPVIFMSRLEAERLPPPAAVSRVRSRLRNVRSEDEMPLGFGEVL